MDKKKSPDYMVAGEEIDELVEAIEKAEDTWEKDKRRRKKEKKLNNQP